MLPKKFRLNLSQDFKRVAAGKKLESNYLKLFIKIKKLSPTRIGVAIPSRDFKKAHERNQVKRLVWNAFKAHYKHLPTNLEIIALPKPGIVGVKSEELINDLKKILLKI